MWPGSRDHLQLLSQSRCGSHCACHTLPLPGPEVPPTPPPPSSPLLNISPSYLYLVPRYYRHRNPPGGLVRGENFGETCKRRKEERQDWKWRIARSGGWGSVPRSRLWRIDRDNWQQLDPRYGSTCFHLHNSNLDRALGALGDLIGACCAGPSPLPQCFLMKLTKLNADTLQQLLEDIYLSRGHRPLLLRSPQEIESWLLRWLLILNTNLIIFIWCFRNYILTTNICTLKFTIQQIHLKLQIS